jgi:N-acetylmuramoyl-L-alanine amidase
MNEAEIVLINARKLGERLERLGARVIQTRTEDVNISLRERVMVSREAQPDMFISLHANSVAETTDATNIRGFTVWYRNESSHFTAALIMDQMKDVNPHTNRWPNPSRANFYVCRPTWTPSVLLEASFMSNIDDFAWMITERYQHLLADETVAALMVYYGRQ